MAYTGTHLGEPDLVAWIGDNGTGTYEIEIKEVTGPHGSTIPLVNTADHVTKLKWAAIVQQLQRQADRTNRTIRLVRYEAAEELIVIQPKTEGTEGTA